MQKARAEAKAYICLRKKITQNHDRCACVYFFHAIGRLEELRTEETGSTSTGTGQKRESMRTTRGARDRVRLGARV